MAGVLVAEKRSAIVAVAAMLVLVSQKYGKQAAAAGTCRVDLAGFGQARCIDRSTAVRITSCFLLSSVMHHCANPSLCTSSSAALYGSKASAAAVLAARLVSAAEDPQGRLGMPPQSVA